MPAWGLEVPINWKIGIQNTICWCSYCFFLSAPEKGTATWKYQGLGEGGPATQHLSGWCPVAFPVAELLRETPSNVAGSQVPFFSWSTNANLGMSISRRDQRITWVLQVTVRKSFTYLGRSCSEFIMDSTISFQQLRWEILASLCAVTSSNVWDVDDVIWRSCSGFTAHS